MDKIKSALVDGSNSRSESFGNNTIVPSELKQLDETNFGNITSTPGSITKFNSTNDQIIELKERLELAKKIKQIFEQNRYDTNAPFYDTKIRRVFDRTEQEPYLESFKYTDYETRTTQVPTLVSYTERVPVQKSRVNYRTQTQYYTVQVPKTKMITKYRTQTTSYKDGPRRYLGIIGPRQWHHATHQVPYRVRKTYYQEERRSRQVQKAYTQSYTDYETQEKTRWEMRDKTERVQVEKTGTKTLYRSRYIYKYETYKEFNSSQYQDLLNQTDACIRKYQNELDNIKY